MAVSVEEDFDYEGHSDAGGAGCAGYEAEGHAAAVDPPFVYDADDGVVED